jgi:hypothetical protein
MMLNTLPEVATRPLDPTRWVRRAVAANRPLAVVGLAMLVVLAGTLVGLAVDPRVITGAPAWLKPAKFAVSIAIYSFTLLWLLNFIQGHRRLVGLVSWVTAAVMVLEIVLIAAQAARGTPSHFNVGTSLDAALFRIMGAGIAGVWLMGLVAAALLLRQRLPDAAFAWSLRLAILVALVGMAVAFLMTTPTPAQRAAARAGQAVTMDGAHSVGVADGGPSLPVVGWSTEGGDLRVAHFVGIHALQALPLVGWLLTRRIGRLRPGQRLALVWAAGLAYLGLVLLLTWQALRGQPLMGPDALTLGALAGLVAAAGLVVGVVLLSMRRAAT